MHRLERHQAWVYLGAIGAGLGLGTAAPGLSGSLDAAVWPTLGLLLYVTFLHLPLAHLPGAARDTRFVVAVLITNFVVLPAVVWALLPLAPADPAVRLGVVLVLVVPCTDWYLTFSHLGGADTARALAVTPINLLVQLVLLPLYVRLLVGEPLGELTGVRVALVVFTTLIVVPLAAAWATQRGAERRVALRRLRSRLAPVPVPLVATVVFLIAASQVSTVTESVEILGRLAAVFAAFLVAALLLGRAVGSVAGLPAGAARALVFSAGTRNSFVVLPLALALAEPWTVAAVVVVFQSLVELLGMVAYLRVVPRLVR
jgi:ACR3 family arsenite efflux pump ArsB